MSYETGEVHFCSFGTNGLHVKVDFQKSPSSDFIWRAPLVARDRLLRGQKRLAPLAKRSTCSKSNVKAEN